MAESGLVAPRGYDRYFLVVGAGNNRKFARLTDSERCAHFLGVLSVAAQSPVRGYLLVSESEEAGAEEVAMEAHVTVKVAKSALAKLVRVGVLVRDDEVGAWFVHDWDEVNPPPKVDRSNADRQRAFRARNAGRNAPITPSVTTPEVEVEVEGEELQPFAVVSGSSEKGAWE